MRKRALSSRGRATHKTPLARSRAALVELDIMEAAAKRSISNDGVSDAESEDGDTNEEETKDEATEATEDEATEATETKDEENEEADEANEEANGANDDIKDENDDIGSETNNDEKKSKVLDDGTTCPICLEIIIGAKVPTCGHAICTECHENLGDVEKCPVCRAEVTPLQYSNCLAFDRAIKALHPSKVKTAKSENKRLTVDSLDSLKKYKEMRTNTLIEYARKLVWEEAKRYTGVTTAFILVADDAPEHLYEKMGVNADINDAWEMMFDNAKKVFEGTNLKILEFTRRGVSNILVELP